MKSHANPEELWARWQALPADEQQRVARKSFCWLMGWAHDSTDETARQWFAAVERRIEVQEKKVKTN